jgi:hypothetical protein
MTSNDTPVHTATAGRLQFDREWHIKSRQLTEAFGRMEAFVNGMSEALGIEKKQVMEYGQWLANHKLADNWTNRFRYAAWLEARKLRGDR